MCVASDGRRDASASHRWKMEREIRNVAKRKMREGWGKSVRVWPLGRSSVKKKGLKQWSSCHDLRIVWSSGQLQVICRSPDFLSCCWLACSIFTFVQWQSLELWLSLKHKNVEGVGILLSLPCSWASLPPVTNLAVGLGASFSGAVGVRYGVKCCPSVGTTPCIF